MINVTFEFKTVEEAIATLGKVMAGAATPVLTGGSKAVPDADKASTPAGPIVAPATPTGKSRKPRADAGKPRGSYKEVQSEVPAGAVTPQEGGVTGAPVQAPAGAPQETVAQADRGIAVDDTQAEPSKAPAAAAPTLEDAQKAMEKYFNAHGLPEAMALLAKFGTARVGELKPEQRAEFIKATEAV